MDKDRIEWNIKMDSNKTETPRAHFPLNVTSTKTEVVAEGDYAKCVPSWTIIPNTRRTLWWKQHSRYLSNVQNRAEIYPGDINFPPEGS